MLQQCTTLLSTFFCFRVIFTYNHSSKTQFEKYFLTKYFLFYILDNTTKRKIQVYSFRLFPIEDYKINQFICKYTFISYILTFNNQKKTHERKNIYIM